MHPPPEGYEDRRQECGQALPAFVPPLVECDKTICERVCRMLGRRGLFVIGRAFFERSNPARHRVMAQMNAP